MSGLLYGFTGLQIVGVASIAGANPPTITWQTGLLDPAGITRNGAGDYTFTLGAQYSVDATESIPIIINNQAVAASGLISYGVARPADNTIRITAGVEAAMGGASVLSDSCAFILILLKRPIR